MSPNFSKLRRCIYSNEEELLRFRQLVVNTVMATDIVDKELQALRKDRWASAFSQNPVDSTTSPSLDVNRKATIVIEHLIQASDVSHTMQHWHIYKQWVSSIRLDVRVISIVQIRILNCVCVILSIVYFRTRNSSWSAMVSTGIAALMT